jgi:hypothetical protein
MISNPSRGRNPLLVRRHSLDVNCQDRAYFVTESLTRIAVATPQQWNQWRLCHLKCLDQLKAPRHQLDAGDVEPSHGTFDGRFDIHCQAAVAVEPRSTTQRRAAERSPWRRPTASRSRWSNRRDFREHPSTCHRRNRRRRRRGVARDTVGSRFPAAKVRRHDPGHPRDGQSFRPAGRGYG